jgi:hypothetical protein
MQYFGRNGVRGLALPAAAMLLTLGGCGSGGFSDMMPRTSDLTSFEWNPYSKASSPVLPSFTRKTATPADYVNPDGSCAGLQTQAPDSEPTASVPTGGTVALQMTECAVVRALGAPERVDLGSNERGERSAKLLYSRGERPGLYSFTGGVLTEIERVEPPEPPKPQKKPPPAKPQRRSVT